MENLIPPLGYRSRYPAQSEPSPMRLPKFTIRSVLIATAICATVIWTLKRPGRRTEQFADAIRSGNTMVALAMLGTASNDDILFMELSYDVQYRVVVEHVSSLADSEHGSDLRQIEIQPPTISQILTCRRSVLVGQGWGGGNCELIVTLTSVRPGRNWFNEY